MEPSYQQKYWKYCTYIFFIFRYLLNFIIIFITCNICFISLSLFFIIFLIFPYTRCRFMLATICVKINFTNTTLFVFETSKRGRICCNKHYFFIHIRLFLIWGKRKTSRQHNQVGQPTLQFSCSELPHSLCMSFFVGLLFLFSS